MTHKCTIHKSFTDDLGKTMKDNHINTNNNAIQHNGATEIGNESSNANQNILQSSKDVLQNEDQNNNNDSYLEGMYVLLF